MPDLTGEVALVTGGAKRIGAAIATALHHAGADVVIHYDSSKREATELAARLTAGERKAWAVPADLANVKHRAKLLHLARQAANAPVTLLVNNASTFPESTVANLSREELRQSVEVNAWAPFTLTRTFAAELPDSRRGAVVNLLDSRIADYDWSHVGYWLAKRMLADMTRLCALEFAPRVTVNGVSPGPVLGPTGKDAEDGKFLERMAKHLPLRRTPTPADVAETVVHLLAARSVTGQFVDVDGGRHLGRAVYG